MSESEIIIKNKKMKMEIEIDDIEYGKIKRCIYESKIIYIIDGKIVQDEKIINKLELKYGFRIDNKAKNIIY